MYNLDTGNSRIMSILKLMLCSSHYHRHIILYIRGVARGGGLGGHVPRAPTFLGHQKNIE